MPSDITRTSDDVRQKYGPPVMQQGRVILDRDFNALQQTLATDLAAETLDSIGPCGTPDNGFQIMLQPPGGSTAPWDPIIIPSSPLSEAFDFYIGPGTMYAGGQRAVFPAHAAGQSSPPGQSLPLYYSYNNQPDWLTPAVPSAQPQQEAISLLLHEQEVSAVEDPDLLDAALGGPDTTQRLRLMRRIERIPGNACSAPADAWSQRGYQLDPKTMRLLPQVKLQVSFIQSQSQNDPCDPVAAGGFLGAFNQLIRIQLRKGINGPVLLWSYDNASFIYRVTPEFQNSGVQTLTLAQAPVDVFHQPAAGQVVEILRTAAVLADDPDNTDSTQQKKILRCIAEPMGFVTTLSASFDPTSKTVELSDALPGEFAGDPQLFLRVWQSQAAINSGGQPIPLNDFNNSTTGLQVTLTLPDGATEFPDGAFWMIAVRPATPQAIYPERFLVAPQTPDGPRLWLCPLAVIDWATSPASILHDCRSKFCNLVGLTKRERASCCKFRVGDGVETFGDFTSIQTAINNLPPQGGEICVLPGRYFEYISLVGLTDVTIHGCGAETRIASPALQPVTPPAANADTAVASEPVVSIQNCSHIELRSFVVETATDNIGISIGNGAATGNVRTPSSDIVLRKLIVIGANDSGVFMQGNSLCLEHSIIAMQNVRCDNPAIFAAGRDLRIADNWVGQVAGAVLPDIVQTDYAMGSSPVEISSPTFSAARIENLADVMTDNVASCGGIQIGGFSTNVEICRSEIQGGFGNGITLGSVLILSANNQVTPEILVRKFRPALDPCAPGTFQLPPANPYGPAGGRWVVEGPLENVCLGHNRISQMGLAGIGPIGFFDLTTTQEVVTITDLCIQQNVIANCPNDRVGQTDSNQNVFTGYGGIVLPDVSNLIIRDNRVVDFGASWMDPVSGIFVLHGEQIEISRNQITDSRNWSNEVSTRASDLRAGIYISMATPPPNTNATANTASLAGNFSRFEGFVSGDVQPSFYTPAVPALSIVDNVVNVPLGRTLFAMGAGAFSIRGNSFATFGLTGSANRAAPIGIMLINLGIPVDPFSASVLEALEILSMLLAKAQTANQASTAQVPATLANLGPGPVIFSQNRCCVDLSAAPAAGDKIVSLCSTLIVSFDDVGFHDNQCILISGIRQVTLDVLLLGCSLRATGNRVQEIPDTVGMSLLTAGFENITSLNITSNTARAFSYMLLNATNVNLMNF